MYINSSFATLWKSNSCKDSGLRPYLLRWRIQKVVLRNVPSPVLRRVTRDVWRLHSRLRLRTYSSPLFFSLRHLRLTTPGPQDSRVRCSLPVSVHVQCVRRLVVGGGDSLPLVFPSEKCPTGTTVLLLRTLCWDSCYDEVF